MRVHILSCETLFLYSYSVSYNDSCLLISLSGKLKKLFPICAMTVTDKCSGRVRLEYHRGMYRDFQKLLSSFKTEQMRVLKNNEITDFKQ